MELERKKTIVKEIEHWQRSKLLPDHYCDFLLNLYLEDPTERQAPGLRGKAATKIRQAHGKVWLLVFSLISFLCMVGLYFNSFPLEIQIGCGLILIVLLLVAGHRIRKRSESAGIALIGAGMLTLLVSGLLLLQQLEDQLAAQLEAPLLEVPLDENYIWLRIVFLGLSALLWIFYGVAARIPLLHLGGWVAAIMVYALLLFRAGANPAWYDVQLYWVPAAFLIAWVTWFVQRWSKPVAAVLFTVAVLLWFMPEVYTVLLLEQPQWLQLQVLVKIAVGGGMLFALRKRWITWVA